MNSATLFLALRYLRPKRTFVSVITIISILGIAVGVLMMIVVRSVMQGFEVDFRNTLIAVEPHVMFVAGEKTDKAPPPDWQKLVDAARSQTGVLSATPFAGGGILIERKEYETAAVLFGTKPDEARARLDKLKPQLVEGSLDLPDGTLVVSDITAADLAVGLGDEVNVYPSDAVIDIAHRYRAAADERDEAKKKQALKQIKLEPMKLRVSGIIRDEIGTRYSYASLATGQKVFHLDAGVSGVAVELNEPRAAAAFAEKVKKTGAVPADWKTQLWLDAGEARLAAMENEQVMMQLVLLIIAAVAAFSVMNTTITVTTQKRREIGVLTAIGARPGMVVSIFVLQAAIVGVLGTVLGLIGSFLVLAFRNDIRAAISMIGGGEVHAVDGVFLATIPAHVEPRDVILTCCISIALSLFAAVVPAFFASRLDPAEALRD